MNSLNKNSGWNHSICKEKEKPNIKGLELISTLKYKIVSALTLP